MIEVKRRDLLKGAVLGSAGVLSASAFAVLGQPVSAQQITNIEAGARDPRFAMGLVHAIEGPVIVALNEESLIQHLELTNMTQVWKGYYTTIEDVKPGDFFYARGTPTLDSRFLADTIWVNIVSLPLHVIDVKEKRIIFSGPQGQYMGHCRRYTSCVYGDTPPCRDLSGLQTGQHVHVIGCWRPGTDEFDISRIFA